VTEGNAIGTEEIRPCVPMAVQEAPCRGYCCEEWLLLEAASVFLKFRLPEFLLITRGYNYGPHTQRQPAACVLLSHVSKWN
jgi:hypothetical protein